MHERGTPNNLLVIEVKKSTNKNTKHIKHDYNKLERYKADLDYQFALFLKIGTGENWGTYELIPEEELDIWAEV